MKYFSKALGTFGVWAMVAYIISLGVVGPVLTLMIGLLATVAIWEK